MRDSARPRRLFEDTTVTARAAGVLRGRARVLDSTPLFDAVATQDTVTQLRAAIRRLLMVLDQTAPVLAARVRHRLGRDDDYASAGKPPCDWDDPEARDRLVVDLVGDCLAALSALDGIELTGAAAGAVELVALVAGQDVEVGPDGLFRIARGVARDRQISTVDGDARHGHKSKSRRFDGYKGHVSLDPDSELIDNVAVTPANAHDATAAVKVLKPCAAAVDKPVVLGDCAYAGGDTRETLEEAGFEVMAKVPAATNRDGRFTKDDFDVNVDAGTVTCPAAHTVTIRPAGGKTNKVNFAAHCAGCPLRDRCTTSTAGRQVAIHRHEKRLQKAKAEQASEEWRAAYRADRPKVERKIAHLARRWWGGRHARCRGLERVSTEPTSTPEPPPSTGPVSPSSVSRTASTDGPSLGPEPGDSHQPAHLLRTNDDRPPAPGAQLDRRRAVRPGRVALTPEATDHAQRPRPPLPQRSPGSRRSRVTAPGTTTHEED